MFARVGIAVRNPRPYVHTRPESFVVEGSFYRHGQGGIGEEPRPSGFLG